VTQQLVFTLAAPYGAFAVTFNAANAAVKSTRLDPPKSALVGLLGAALGLERLALNDLADRLFVAVRVGLRPRPDPKPDYHTITPPVPPRDSGPWTRFEELRAALSGLADQGAILSSRHHWQTGLWTVAVARRGGGGPPLSELRDALTHPRWPLYAGRKACGLGLPPDPDIIEASGPVEALDSYGWPWTRQPRLREHLSQLAAAVEEAPGCGST
jgi:CRISPR system Cascade subunit CasD